MHTSDTNRDINVHFSHRQGHASHHQAFRSTRKKVKGIQKKGNSGKETKRLLLSYVYDVSGHVIPCIYFCLFPSRQNRTSRTICLDNDTLIKDSDIVRSCPLYYHRIAYIGKLMLVRMLHSEGNSKTQSQNHRTYPWKIYRHSTYPHH